MVAAPSEQLRDSALGGERAGVEAHGLVRAFRRSDDRDAPREVQANALSERGKIDAETVTRQSARESSGRKLQ